MKLSSLKNCLKPVAIVVTLSALSTLAYSPSKADDAADKAAISALVENIYKAISGPVGQDRDWALFDSLYTPDARLRVSRQHPERGLMVITRTPAEYKAGGNEYLKQVGFTEKELSRRTYLYGNMATVLSAYEARSAKDDSLIAKGINSMSLIRTPDGWKIAHVMWSEENATWPLARGFEADDRAGS